MLTNVCIIEAGDGGCNPQLSICCSTPEAIASLFGF